MADGHCFKKIFDHNSAADCPISVKFCTKKQNGTATEFTYHKL